jgi:cytochrome P450
LTYTEAVLRETLRLYSVVPMVVRTPIEDDEVSGVPSEEYFNFDA